MASGHRKGRGSPGIEVEHERNDRHRFKDVLQWGWFGRSRAYNGRCSEELASRR